MSNEEKFIDREVEREGFRNMLKFVDEKRLLTIKAKGGRGKSSLLKRLRYECHYIEDIAASLISLDNPEIVSEFDLVKAIREDLKNYVEFKKFDVLDSARMQKDPAPFTNLVSSGSGAVNAQFAQIKDRGIIAGQVDTIMQNVENLKLELKQRKEWPSDDYEEFVRQYCVAAFFEDLQDLCKERPVVILLDAWEKCGETLKRWIVRPMLHLNCFDTPNRPANLVFVLAGREMPPLKERLGDSYSSLVVSLENLSDWEFKHMKEFLEVHDYKGLNDKDIEFIQEKVNAGMSLEDALMFAKLIKGE